MNIKKILTFNIIFILFFSSISFSLFSEQSIAGNNSEEAAFSIDNLEIGDIVFCDVRPIVIEIAPFLGIHRIDVTEGFSNDHVVMYIGNNKFIEACPYFYQPLKEQYIGVVITQWLLLKSWATNFTYGSVDTTEEKIKGAIKWAKTQIGKPYGTSDGYFCGELIFHAFESQDVRLKITWDGVEHDAWVPMAMRVADNIMMKDPNTPPVAVIESENNGVINRDLYFNGWNSYDVDGRIVNWTWDFGDNSRSFDDYSVGHRYEKPGNYTVKLTVCDNRGDSDSTTIDVFIIDDGADPNNGDDNNNESDDNNDYSPPDDSNDHKLIESKSSEASSDILLLVFLMCVILFLLVTLIWILKK
jgi:hypothetical protein